MAQPNSNELPDALRACRRYFATALIFSLAINLLYLAIVRVGTDAALGRRSAARHDLGNRIGCALPSRAQCAAVLFENIPLSKL
jgi:hypothetical protein